MLVSLSNPSLGSSSSLTSTALAPPSPKLAFGPRSRRAQLGVSFRRQVLIGGFIADFCAPSRKLVVEVDGGYHRRKPRADESRDRKLLRLGYRVVRVSAELVMRDLPAAVAAVRAAF